MRHQRRSPGKKPIIQRCGQTKKMLRMPDKRTAPIRDKFEPVVVVPMLL